MPSYSHVVICFLAGIMSVVAQQKPDFSGECTLNRQASTLSPIVAPAAQSGVLRVDQPEPRFTSQLTIVLDGKSFESRSRTMCGYSSGRDRSVGVHRP